MKEEKLLDLLGQLDERYIAGMCESYASLPGERRTIPLQKHRRGGRTLLIAAVTVSLITLAALAVGYGIHRQRQAELRQTLKIDEAQTESYVEYAVPESGAAGSAVTLLSSIPDGSGQKLYVNISPVERETAENYPHSANFFYCVGDKGLWGAATPVLRADRTLREGDDIGAAVLEDAYDEESRTLTLFLHLPGQALEKELDANGQAEITILRLEEDEDTSDCELFNDWIFVHKDEHSCGSFLFTPNAPETRRVEFVPVPVTEPVYGRSAEVLALELSPTDAVWHIRYEGLGEENREVYALEDYVTQNAKLVFSDGRSLSPGGAVTNHYEPEEAALGCAWQEAVNIQALEAVYIGEIKLEIR